MLTPIDGFGEPLYDLEDMFYSGHFCGLLHFPWRHAILIDT